MLLVSASISAGHILLPALLAAPCEARRAELLHATQVLRSGHLRDAGTSLLAAFQWGHYYKVSLRGHERACVQACERLQVVLPDG